MQKKHIFGLAALVAAAFIVLFAGCNTDDSARRFAVRVSAAPASIPVNGTSTITAEVTNFEGTPIQGISIEWGTSLGNLQSGDSVTSSAGRASATLSGDGTTTGTAIVTGTALTTRERGQTEVRIGLD